MNEQLRMAEQYIDDAALSIVDGNKEYARRYMVSARNILDAVQGAPMDEMVEAWEYFQAVARLCL